jgi:excisionase family DNA binding protein
VKYTFAELSNPDVLDKIPREQIAPMIAQCAALQSALAAKLLQSIPDAAMVSSKPDCLITVDVAAERLAFTSQYLYDLIRKGKFPAIREGKYLRIRESDFSAWIDKHQENIVDNELYHPYSKRYGRQRTQTDQKLNGPYAGANGKQNRRKVKHNRPLGTGRVEDIRTRFKVHSTTGEVGDAGQTEG